MSSLEEHAVKLTRRKYLRYLDQQLPQGDNFTKERLVQLRSLDVLIEDDRPAFVLRYPYGATIAHGGTFHAPCQHSDCTSCREVEAAFVNDSATIPLALVLQNVVEVFLSIADDQRRSGDRILRSRPARLLAPGELFGVFETLDTLFDHDAGRSAWNVVAGARSIALLLTRRTDLVNWLTDRVHRDFSNGTRKERGDLVERLASDDWELAKYFHSLPRDSTSDTKGTDRFETTVVVFPSLGNTVLRKHYPAIVALGAVGWLQSKALRQQATDTAVLASMPYLQRTKIPREQRIALLGTVQQILAAGRGDMPVFLSASHADSVRGVPLDAITHFLKEVFGTTQALVLQPHQLQRAGHEGFISVKVNCLPAFTETVPRNFGAFCSHVESFLSTIAWSGLDLDRTQMLPGRQAVHEMLGVDDKSIDLTKNRIPERHPFLTGCLRIVRAG